MKTKHIEGNVLSIDAINRMLNSRIDNLIAMHPFDDVDTQIITHDGCTIYISTNGASVAMTICPSMVIPGGSTKEYALPESVRPLGDLVRIESGVEFVEVSIDLDRDNAPRLVFVNGSKENITLYERGNTMFTQYPAFIASVPEVIDMRVGYDGTQYDTAGEAIREQLSKAMELAEGGGYIGKDGCAEGDVNLDGNSINGVEVLVIGDSESDRGFAITYMGQHDDDDAQVAEFAGVVGDEAVRMRNIAPGVQDKDAVNMEQFTGATDLLDDINADVGQLMDSLGDIDSALDAIIAIQNELIGIITFYIYSTEFTAVKGMTWGEWLESDYYSDILYLDGINIVSDDGPVYTPDGNAVTTSDVIIANCEYTH